MSAPIQPQGPLPARVYWVRRLLVLAVAVLLVVGVASLLGGGSDASSGSDGSGGDRAAAVSAEHTRSPGTAESSAPEPAGGPEESAKGSKPGKERLVRPDGQCEAGDVLVTPQVLDKAEGGRDVAFRLKLSTREAAACTWTVSPETVTMSITSGTDDIWSSQHCGEAIPTRDVVLRRDAVRRVRVVWDARRSDPGCPGNSEWADLGYYHVQSAALGGEPDEQQFELERPVSETVTKTITPEPKPKKADRKKRAGKADDEDGRNRRGPGRPATG